MSAFLTVARTTFYCRSERALRRRNLAWRKRRPCESSSATQACMRGRSCAPADGRCGPMLRGREPNGAPFHAGRARSRHWPPAARPWRVRGLGTIRVPQLGGQQWLCWMGCQRRELAAPPARQGPTGHPRASSSLKAPPFALVGAGAPASRPEPPAARLRERHLAMAALDVSGSTGGTTRRPRVAVRLQGLALWRAADPLDRLACFGAGATHSLATLTLRAFVRSSGCVDCGHFADWRFERRARGGPAPGARRS